MSAEPTEVTLLALARAGDPDALRELYEQHAKRLYYIAIGITRSPHDAEDVVQDLFVGLPEAIRTYGPQGSLGSWIARVAVRLALAKVRREGRRRRWERQAGNAKEMVMPEDVDTRLTLDRFLDRMREDWRHVYVLRELNGFTHAEIAELMGITEAYSMTMLYRARRFLAQRLRDKR